MPSGLLLPYLLCFSINFLVDSILSLSSGQGLLLLGKCIHTRVKSILWLSKSLLSSVFFCLVATIPKNVTFSVAFHSQETEHILGYHQKSNWPSLPKVLLSPQFSSSCYSKSFLPLKLQYSSFFFDVLTTLQLNFGEINLVCTPESV